MSSAILYLAIVAIWACVLIPRWLRRDQARGTSAPVTAAPPVSGSRGDPGERGGGQVDGHGDGRGDARGDAEAGDGPVADDVRRPAPAPARVAEPVSAEEGRRRMLSARRRLLLMLAGLEVAAIVLAMLSLAAVWVVIPPSVMLFGYLLLLREAARSDAERARQASEAAERARARRVRIVQARPAATAEDAPAEGVATTAAALAAKFAAAPVAADYADFGPGRDFAPGLAGKYTTSNSGAEAADDDYYSDYEPPRLRAVGD